MKILKTLITALLVIIGFLYGLNIYLDRSIESLKEKKDYTEIRHTYNNVSRDRGLILKQMLDDKNDIMLFGSSELSSEVPQRSANYFPNNDSIRDITILGRAYTQSLQQASLIGSLNSGTKNTAMIVSIQWFFNKDGITRSDYWVNFSPTQFYSILNDEKIPQELRDEYARRNEELLYKSPHFLSEYYYAKSYNSKNIAWKAAYYLLKPYTSFKEMALTYKDKYNTLKELRNAKDIVSRKVKEVDWKKTMDEAIAMATPLTDKNPLKIDNEYYDKYIKDKYDSVEGIYSRITPTESKELYDLELVLKIAASKKIKPLIIINAVNGNYYDYLGLDRKKREDFSNEIKNLSAKYSLDVLDLSLKDYEDYYLRDVMHLGWKGWVDLNYELSKRFK